VIRTTIRGKLSVSDSALPVQLWMADGRPIPVGLDVASIRPEATSAIPVRDDSAHAGPLYASRGSVFYWIVVPLSDGRRRTGWLAEQRRISSTPEEGRLIEGLVGPGVRVYFRNDSGSAWATLAGEPTQPPTSERHREGLTLRTRTAEPRGALLAAESPIRGTPWRLTLELPVAAATAGARATSMRLALFAALLLVLAGLAAWLLSRHLAKPLVDLTAAAETMARGDFSSRVTDPHVARGDEIGRLAASFSRMTSQLSQSRSELEQQVAEARSLSEELEQTNARLHR
jgi:HAMP domain-containing protein